MRKSEKKMRVVGYVRVSTKKQAEEGDSIQAQIDRINYYCNDPYNNMELVEILVDAGVSASKPLATRDEGKKVAAMVENGEVEAVITCKLDRLFRSSSDAAQTIDKWTKKEIHLHIIDQRLDTSDITGRLIFRVLTAVAEMEREMASERTSSVMSHKKENKVVYGRTPFGYDQTDNMCLIPNQEEQKVVDEIFEWKESGIGLREIARRLNKRGIRTKNDKDWHASSVKYILENDLYEAGA